MLLFLQHVWPIVSVPEILMNQFNVMTTSITVNTLTYNATNQQVNISPSHNLVILNKHNLYPKHTAKLRAATSAQSMFID